MTTTIVLDVNMVFGTIAVISFAIPFLIIGWVNLGMSAFGGWNHENWFMIGLGTVVSSLISLVITATSYGLFRFIWG